MMLAAGIGMAATIAGGAITASGQQQSGKLEKQMYDYRAAVAEQNRIYESNLGERKAGELGLRQAQTVGAQKAAQGASGLDVNTGSNKEVQQSQFAVNRMEQQDVRDAAMRRAYGEQVQEKLYTASGQQAEYAGRVKSTGTILGTVSSVADKWMQASKLGMFGDISSGSA